MANRKISDLTALTTPATGDLLPIVDISEAAAADKNKKITFGELFASIPAGIAAAPSVAFEGYNTGIYSPGADQVAISTNGTGRLFVDASGNVNIDSNTFYVDAANNRVGIGTTGPGTELHVAASSGYAELRLAGASGSGASVEFYNSATQLGDIFIDPSNNMIFRNASEAFRVDSSRRLLVGTNTNSGANLLQVNSDALVNGLTVGRGTSAISSNTAVGNSALYSNTTGSQNTANGLQALYSNTTGNQNTANGVKALYSNTTGNQNTTNGFQTLQSNTTGNYNTANGVNALQSNTTGSNNTANGVNALYFNTTGTYNTANGVNALYSNTTGTYNTANGLQALYSNTTGNYNTANGVNAGYGVGTNSNTTGSNNTFIGNESVGASSTANNVITLGNGAIATLRAQVTTITALSDERDKKNIVPLNAGLDFLTRLRPVSFTWNTRDKAKVDVEDTGFIAQELLAVQEDTGITIPNLVSQENPDKLEAGYGTLIPVLVSAVQELTAMVKQLQDEIITLKGDN